MTEQRDTEQRPVEDSNDSIHAVALEGKFTRNSVVWGPPGKYAYERIVDGEVAADVFPEIVETIRGTLNSRGRFAERDGALDWSSELEIVHITVEPRNGRTAVRILGDASWDVIATYCVVTGIVAAVLIGAWLKSGSGLGLGFAAVFVVGGYAVARTAWHAVARRFRRKLARLVRILDTSIGRLTGSGANSGRASGTD